MRSIRHLRRANVRLRTNKAIEIGLERYYPDRYTVFVVQPTPDWKDKVKQFVQQTGQKGLALAPIIAKFVSTAHAEGVISAISDLNGREVADELKDFLDSGIVGKSRISCLDELAGYVLREAGTSTPDDFERIKRNIILMNIYTLAGDKNCMSVYRQSQRLTARTYS